MGHILHPHETSQIETIIGHTYHNFGLQVDRDIDSFQADELENRLQAWSQISSDRRFRGLLDWALAGDNLRVNVEDLPNGYVALESLHDNQLSEPEKAKIIIAVCDALSILHQSAFFMGILSPAMIYFHPSTFEVCLDVQPYPSMLPFLNQTHGNFPYYLISKHARSQKLHRISDFSALGLLIQWVFLGTFVFEEDAILEALPEQLYSLCISLAQNPRQFQFIEEIRNAIAACYWPNFLCELPVVKGDIHWLHPMDTPIGDDNRSKIRDFFRTDSKGTLVVVSENDTLLTDVVQTILDEGTDSAQTFTIPCIHLPFSTLKETFTRTLRVLGEYSPKLVPKAKTLSKKFSNLLRRHRAGHSVIEQLSQLFYDIYSEVPSVFEGRNILYHFQSSVDLDEESFQVMSHLQHASRSKLTQIRILLAGKQIPKYISLDSYSLLHLELKDEVYQRVFTSQLAQVDGESLDKLVYFAKTKGYDIYTIRLLLEELIISGHLELRGCKWFMRDTTHDLSLRSARESIQNRFERINPSDMDMLRSLSWLPAPFEIDSICHAIGFDSKRISYFNQQLSEVGLLRVYQNHHVLIPKLVSDVCNHGLQEEQSNTYRLQALELQIRLNSTSLKVLRELAALSPNPKEQYYFLMLYYRQLRSFASDEQKRDTVSQLKALHEKSGRLRIKVWSRMLARLSANLNDLPRAAQMTKELYLQTNDIADELNYMMYSLLQNNLDVSMGQAQALHVLSDESRPLRHRISAAGFLTRSLAYRQLDRKDAEKVDVFYRMNVLPNSEKISERQFLYLSIHYSILLLVMFPEKQDWANVLLEMLESRMGGTVHHDLKLTFYSVYFFQPNLSVSRKYIYRVLETCQRTRAVYSEQVAHLNAMQFALYQGDVSSYKYHSKRVLEVSDVLRPDIAERHLLFQLIFAREWEMWELFDEVSEELTNRDLSDTTNIEWNLCKCLGVFWRGQSLPPRLKQPTPTENHYTSLIDSLYAIQDGNIELACTLLQQSINANSYYMTAGLAYRELIALLLQEDSSESASWLNQFETYLKSYRYDLFWPDYYRLSGQWHMKHGMVQQGTLYLRRAANLYQSMGKSTRHQTVNKLLEHALLPPYLPTTSHLWSDEEGKRVLEEREKFLNQSLDLLAILQLGQQSTESLDFDVTFQRLTTVLFDYYPVSEVVVMMKLHHRAETVVYCAAGLVNHGDLVSIAHEQHESYEHCLYMHGSKSIHLKMSLKNPRDTSVEHMKQFLTVMKPHVANCVHYLEMMTDSLTGFSQRRFFTDKLEREFVVSERYGMDLSVIMLDLDNFRNVNEFGHAEGDRVLREVAGIIRGVLRKHDIPGRYGGEEFIVILPKTEGRMAVNIAEQIREQIEVGFLVGRPYSTTVSIGVSSLRLCDAKSPDQLISMADQAEIKAKKTGKNRVIAAWSIPG